MKAGLSDFLHRTPWWSLFLAAFGIVVALAVFAVPFQIFRLEHNAATPEEKRAIKREIDLAFSQGAVDLAHGIVKEMRDHASDPARRDELDRALDEIETARESLQEAGAEVARAKRESIDEVTGAVAEAHRALREAQKEAAQALKDAGPERERVERSLADSAEAVQRAGEEAKRAEEASVAPPGAPAPPKRPKVIVIRSGMELQVGPDGKALPPPPPLPPELKREIRRTLSTDLWRIGVGAGLLLIFLPLFALAVVSKFFIDRSRAAQRNAEVKQREAEYHRMSRQVTEAKLAALQAQVEPHFLYNTLASVQALTEVDPRKAHEMTGHLIQYLRNALPKMRESVSTVGQEVELVRAYLNILRMRMGRRLAFDIEVAPGLENAPFPPLMLPSLVENAIKHGLEPLREGGTVSIRVIESGGNLRVTVTDTGRGFGDTVGAGVGLANIRERLAALYGDAAHLTLEANQPQGVVAILEIPRAAPSPDAVRASLGASAGSTRSAPPPASEVAPPSRARRAFSAFGAAERAWRKGLTFTFMVLAAVVAILAVLGVVGVLTGVFHVQLGKTMMGSAAGAFVGTAGMAFAFLVVIVALAIVLALVYGLGFILIGVLAFVIIAILVGLFPVLAPVILLALGIAWLVRRMRPAAPTLESPDAHRHPG